MRRFVKRLVRLLGFLLDLATSHPARWQYKIDRWQDRDPL